MEKGLHSLPGPYRTGFFAESAGNLLFTAIWECVKRYEHDKNIPQSQIASDPEVG